MIVVDASVVMKLLTRETGSALAVDRLAREPDRTAPDWIQIEVASALSKKVRYAGLPVAAAREGFAALPLIVPDLAPSAPLLARAMDLSFEISHAVYDCLYLALALAIDAKVLTADQKFFDLASEMKYRGRVELLE